MVGVIIPTCATRNCQIDFHAIAYSGRPAWFSFIRISNFDFSDVILEKKIFENYPGAFSYNSC